MCICMCAYVTCNLMVYALISTNIIVFSRACVRASVCECERKQNIHTFTQGELFRIGVGVHRGDGVTLTSVLQPLVSHELTAHWTSEVLSGL